MADTPRRLSAEGKERDEARQALRRFEGQPMTAEARPRTAFFGFPDWLIEEEAMTPADRVPAPSSDELREAFLKGCEFAEIALRSSLVCRLFVANGVYRDAAMREYPQSGGPAGSRDQETTR